MYRTIAQSNITLYNKVVPIPIHIGQVIHVLHQTKSTFRKYLTIHSNPDSFADISLPAQVQIRKNRNDNLIIN